MHAYAVDEPEMVLMFIEDEERELKAKGYEPGERFYHDYLREKMPGFAWARYWAGHEEEIAQLRRVATAARQSRRRGSAKPTCFATSWGTPFQASLAFR